MLNSEVSLLNLSIFRSVERHSMFVIEKNFKDKGQTMTNARHCAFAGAVILELFADTFHI